MRRLYFGLPLSIIRCHAEIGLFGFKSRSSLMCMPPLAVLWPQYLLVAVDHRIANCLDGISEP